MSEGVRKEDRLPTKFELVWGVKSQGLSGRGTVVNVSLGGACIELNQTVTLERGTAVSLMCAKIPVLPSSAKVLWIKRLSSASTICGVGFAAHGAAWANWIAQQQPVLTR